jgi:hypothetical protein
MGFRPPERLRDWVLLFTPAALMLLATLAGALFDKREGEHAILLYALLSAFLAVPLSIWLGFRFTKADPKWHVRAWWVLLATGIVAFLNYSIAIGGCAMALAR